MGFMSVRWSVHVLNHEEAAVCWNAIGLEIELHRSALLSVYKSVGNPSTRYGLEGDLIVWTGLP